MALTANSQGVVTGRFTIPAGIPTGTKLVEFEGSGGSSARATFTGRGQITIQELRRVQTITTTITDNFERYDPLAETFTLNQTALISGVDLWFTAKGTTGRTFVEIRECENGVPTARVVASALLQTKNLLLNQWQRFSWAPVRCQGQREYAVVVGCDDAVTKCALAELGKYDSSAQKWITAQPYQIGVMLSSSNASTWTAHQDRDLTFRVLHTPLAATTTTVALPDVAVSGCDELMVLAAVERPTPECDVVFQITLPLGGSITADNQVVTIAEGDRVLLPGTVTGTIKWVAILSGSVDSTPRLHKDLELVWGTRATSGTYITRLLPAGAGSKVSVYFEGIMPGSAGVVVEVSDSGTGSFVPVPFVSGTAIGEGWVDYTYRLLNYSLNSAVVRVTLTGDARNRPMLRKLRVVIS